MIIDNMEIRLLQMFTLNTYRHDLKKAARLMKQAKQTSRMEKDLQRNAQFSEQVKVNQ